MILLASLEAFTTLDPLTQKKLNNNAGEDDG